MAYEWNRASDQRLKKPILLGRALFVLRGRADRGGACEAVGAIVVSLPFPARCHPASSAKICMVRDGQWLVFLSYDRSVEADPPC